MKNQNICDIYNAFEKEFLATSNNIRCVSNMRMVDGRACFTINNEYDLYVWFDEDDVLCVETEYGNLVTHIEEEFVDALCLEDIIVTEGKVTTISVPATKLNEEAIENLKSLIFCKRILIKSMLKQSRLELLEKDKRILLPWFSAIDKEDMETYRRFVLELCNTAIRQKKHTSEPEFGKNLRYTCRCFLKRLGFLGDEGKEDIAIMLKYIDVDAVITSNAYLENNA